MSQRTHKLLIACGVVVVAAVAVAQTGHGSHALSYLPYLAILACPLLHIVMHRTHRHSGDHKNIANP